VREQELLKSGVMSMKAVRTIRIWSVHKMPLLQQDKTHPLE